MASRPDLHVSRINILVAENTTDRESIIAELTAKFGPKKSFALAA